jgi:hypothetical protein
MSIFSLSSNLSLLSGLLPLLAAWYNYKYLDKVSKILTLFLVLSFISDALGFALIDVFHVKNTMYRAHFYIGINIFFFGVIYYYIFFESLLKKAVIVVTIAAFLIAIANVFFVQGIKEYPSISNTALSIMAILFSLVYFYQLFTRQEFVQIQKEGFFWINSGIIFYYSITIFMFMLRKQLYLAHQQDYYMINNITNIIANLIFAVGLLCKPQQKTS